MKREIKNDGVYIEVDANDIVDRIDDIEASKVFVIRNSRLEFAGDEAKKLITLIKKWHEYFLASNPDYAANMDCAQRSDFVLRHIMIFSEESD